MSKAVINRKLNAYLQQCNDAGKLPSIAGLAIALGYYDRRMMLSAARQKSTDEGQAVSLAILRVESVIEDSVISNAVGARWLLGTLPDYEQMKLPEYGTDDITVQIVDDDREEWDFEPLPIEPGDDDELTIERDDD